jgi:hypothetical protein
VLPEVAVLPDSDFSSFDAGASTFDQALKTPQDINALVAQFSKPLGPAKPVPAALLLFWLLAIPLVVAALGWVAISRRRSAFAFG